MIYEMSHTEAQELCDKLKHLGYFVSIAPKYKAYSVLIYGRRHTNDVKEIKVND